MLGKTSTVFTMMTELEASIDSINQKAHTGEGGFTKKLKNAILADEE